MDCPSDNRGSLIALFYSNQPGWIVHHPIIVGPLLLCFIQTNQDGLSIILIVGPLLLCFIQTNQDGLSIILIVGPLLLCFIQTNQDGLSIL